MKSIAVFCGSKPGNKAIYKNSAIEVGNELVKHNISLVYGGSSTGIMGEVANAVLNSGGKVTGVIPKILVNQERAHHNLTELKVVDSMHERKALMYELVDGFITLPGGIGTLEEFFEVFTWNAIGEHQKLCGLLNIGGYYDPLIHLIHHMVDEGFLSKEILKVVVIDDNVERLVMRLIK